MENTQTGPRQIKQYVKAGEVWIVRGTAYPEGTPPRGFIKRPEEVQGYVITKGIPKDFWDAWVEQYGQTDMVRNRLIFACDTYDEIEGVAAENVDVKCAMSPLNMPFRDDEPVDTRIPRPVGSGLGPIERLSV